MQQQSNTSKKPKKLPKSIDKQSKRCNTPKAKKIMKKKDKKESDLQIDSTHTADGDTIGQYTRTVRFAKFAQEVIAKEAEKTNGIICMPGELPPQGETAESMKYTNVRDMRFAKRSILQFRSLGHEILFADYKRLNVLCMLQGKKTAGIDMVHTLRFLEASFNANIQKITELSPEDNIRAIHTDIFFSKDESAKREPASMITASEIMKSLSLIDVVNVKEIMDDNAELHQFILDTVGDDVATKVQNSINVEIGLVNATA